MGNEDLTAPVLPDLPVLAELTPDERDRLLATVLGNLTNAVVVTDRDGVIRWVNAAFTAQTGYPAAEAIGSTPRLLRSGHHSQRHYQALWTTILAGRPWAGEMVERHRDGHLYTVAQTITPLIGADGEVSHFVAVHEDITRLHESQARFQAMFHNTTDAIVLFDADRRLIDVNPAAAALIGASVEELRGLSLRELFDEPAGRDADARWEALLTLGYVRGERSFTSRTGRVVTVEYQAIFEVLPGVHAGIGRDVTAERESEARLRLHGQLLDAVGEAVIATDAGGRVAYWNRAAERLYGWPATAVIGRDIMELNVGPDSRDQAAEIMATVLAGRTWTGEFEVRRRDGTRFPALVTDAPYYDADGRLAGVIGVSADITELKNSRDRLERLATHDVVTGLPNAVALRRALETERDWSAQSGRPYALLHLDIDGFRYVNSGLGRETGDEVLRAFAARLGDVGREQDTLARVGADEFALLCRDADDGDALALAVQLRTALQQPFVIAGVELLLTASIGVAVATRGGVADQVVRDADAALRRAQEQGHNRVEVFDEGMRLEARRRLGLASRLQQALEEGGIEVHYQPVVALDTGLVVGMEALARWRLPDGRLVAPDAFIPLAEEIGLIGTLGDQVLRKAIADLQSWRQAGHDLFVAVNVSPRQFSQRGFADRVLALLDEAALAPTHLQLEVTESAMMEDADIEVAVATLHAAGITFAIDDFGTGYSSLASLRRLPADVLKIDRSFVARMTTDEQDRALVAAAVDLAATFGLVAVAEGVETPLQRELLHAMGCAHAQGHLWSPPQPAAEVARFLAASPTVTSTRPLAPAMRRLH